MEIEFKNVSKSFYENNKKAFGIDNLNFKLSGPMFVAVTGSSGCGKSTLLNLILKTEKSDSGSILITGIKSEVAIIYQNYNLFENYSAWFNVALPRLISGTPLEEAKNEAIHLIKEFNLSYLGDKLVKHLSGGEKQRIAIMRSLITHPKIILADEPTGALDHENGEYVFNLLQKLSKTCLVIVVTHNLNLATQYAERIIKLEDGKIIADDLADSHSVEQLPLPKGENKKRTSQVFKYYIFAIAFNRIKQGKLRFTMIALMLSICLIFTLLSVSFAASARELIDSQTSKYANYGIFNISKIEKISIENSFITFQKMQRPTFNEIDSLKKIFPSLRTFYHLGGLVDEIVNLKMNDKLLENVRFLPLFNHEALQNNEVYVNDLLWQKLEEKKVFNITFSQKTRVAEKAQDTFQLKKDFHVIKIIEEFPFMNSPCIYYSYTHFTNLLMNYNCENYSKQLGRAFTWYDAIILANDSEPLSYYSLLISFELEEVKNVMDFFRKEYISKATRSNFEISSFPLTIMDATENLLSAIEMVVMAFVALCVIGTILTLAISAYAFVYEHKRESAILQTLGVSQNENAGIFLEQNLFIFIISMLISTILIFIINVLLNNGLKSIFGVSNFMGIDVSMIFIMFFSGIMIMIVMTYLTSFLANRHDLSATLREE